MPAPQGRLVLKVLDFGLSSGPEELKLARLAGTLSYMAPELLCSQPPSTASDLYAVGMVAYELLTGEHPFALSLEDGGATRLLFKVLRELPDLSRLPGLLGAVVGRTLSKRPEERPPDVATLLRELCLAAGISRLDEPLAVRESFLIAARFVGREGELRVLSQALMEAQMERGAAWLLGGESGAGKSRLLEELRSLALVAGVVVARGQAISEGGSAYQLWKQVLKVLVLHVEISDQEAAVLGRLLPDLEVLLDRPVEAPPAELDLDIDVQAARLHRLRVLREIVLRAPRPVLILLEDLHWADAESLALLAQLSAAATSHPLLIIASYRNDEAPHLPDALPGARVLRLGKLERPEMERLCHSMLGPPSPTLLDLIERETEGNALFIVEVVRALAEDAGELGEVVRRGLPRRLFVGGVEQVLARRLARVPDGARGLLQLAAVMGRQLDVEVLAALYPERDGLIQQCAESGVLEMHEQRWRFSHDKLREQLLARLGRDEQRALHATAAQAIEQTYSARAMPVPVARLARHCHQAQQSAKAIHYYALAGAESLARGAPAEATALLENAVALLQSEALTEAEVPLLTRVQVWRRLTQARYSVGELGSTDQALRQVCKLVGWPLPQPTDTAGFSRKLLRLGAAHLRNLFRQRPQRAQSSELQGELHRELLLTLMCEEIYVWQSQPGITIICGLRGLQLAEELDAVPQRTYFRAAVAFLLSFTPLGGLGLRFLEHEPASAGTIAEIDSLRTRAIVELHRSEFQQSAERASHAVRLAREHKDDFALMSSLLQRQLALIEIEDFAEVQVVCREMERLAAAAQNLIYFMLALIGQLGAHLRFGQLGQAEAIFERTRVHHEREVGPVCEAVLFGLAAMTALRSGQKELARQRADRALDAVVRARWPLLQLRYALIGILDVYLDPDHPDADGLTGEVLAARDERTRKALRLLRWHAVQFKSMRAPSSLYHARHSLLRGDNGRGLRQLEESVKVADRNGRRYDQAQARHWLGRQLQSGPGDRPAADATLRAAAAIYTSIGAAWDAEHIRRSFLSS